MDSYDHAPTNSFSQLKRKSTCWITKMSHSSGHVNSFTNKYCCLSSSIQEKRWSITPARAQLAVTSFCVGCYSLLQHSTIFHMKEIVTIETVINFMGSLGPCLFLRKKCVKVVALFIYLFICRFYSLLC